jgi:hypothetical protein
MLLSTLWIAYVFNAAYGDITTLYYSVFINHTPTVTYTQVFLLAGILLVEPAIVMIVLSRSLSYRANRSSNVVVSGILAAIQVVTLFVGTPTLPYAFATASMTAINLVIIWLAWKWKELPAVDSAPHPGATVAPVTAAP